MVNENNKVKWRVFGKSVKGATHDRNQLPNQDDIRWSQPSEMSLPIILAVSDGHGSAKSFRSEKGSQFAVETALKVLEGFVDDQHDDDNFTAVKNYAEEQLPKELVSKWQQVVEDDIAEHPFTDADWKQLMEKDGTAAAQLAVQKNNFLAYGATLLAVLVKESFILYVQLGDGDILCVDSYGETTRPFPKDEKLIANETTSLCMNEAWREIRVRFVPRSEDPPLLILVSTDGYANSFESEEHFCQIGKDYLRLIRTEGCDSVEQTLEAFLAQTSQRGSGDDITLGIIKRLDTKDLADQLKDVQATLKELVDKVQVIADALKDTVRRDEVQEFIKTFAQLSEVSQSRLEDAVRAYTSSLEELQNRFVDATRTQTRDLQDVKNRLESAAQEESQRWKTFREEQQTQIIGMKSMLADQQGLMNHRIAWLQRGLIATVCLLVIAVTSNISLWFLSARTQTLIRPASTGSPQ